jgi:outer membrane immunogenic protein
MKRLLIASVMSAALTSGAAVAADMPVKAPYLKAPPVAYNWTGFYVGGTAGAAWGSSDPSTSTLFNGTYLDLTNVGAVNANGLQSIKPAGFTGGAEAGYNFQAGDVVAGVETDFEYLGLKGNAGSSALYPGFAPAAGFTINSSAHTDWLFTARPRLGIASNNWLYYVTGGVAVTDLHGNFTFNDSFGVAAESASISNIKAGYAVGGGIEAGLWGNWSLKAEYLYVNFGSVSTASNNLTTTNFGALPGQVFTHSMDLKANIARIGLNHKIN